MIRTTDPLAAHAKLEAAEAKIRHDEAARDQAADELDAALAARGWNRFYGGFAARLYQQPGGNPVELAEVVAHERRVTA